MSRHRSDRIDFTLLGVIVVGFLSLGVWLVLAINSTPATPPPPRPAAVVTVAADPDMAARVAVVTAVDDGMTVHVNNELVPIHIDGITAPTGAACGAPDATSHARTMLMGQRVTLLPDVALPHAGRYLVLPTELSYTDAALRDGYARVELWPWTYRPVYDQEQADARAGHAGLWGGCWA